MLRINCIILKYCFSVGSPVIHKYHRCPSVCKLHEIEFLNGLGKRVCHFLRLAVHGDKHSYFWTFFAFFGIYLYKLFVDVNKKVLLC